MGISKETLATLNISIMQAHLMWLLLIDAYSKWPEIYAMSATTAQATIQQLRT